MKRHFLLVLVFASLLIFAVGPLTASAHEVYVLTPAEVQSALTMPSPNPFGAVPSSQRLFLESGLIALVIMLVALRFSLSHTLQLFFDPILLKLKKFAPLASRLTFGIAMVASGYFRASFGPELPMSSSFSPSIVHIASVLFMVMGVLLILGLYTRLIAFIGLIFFTLLVIHYRGYMVTYTNYLGEMLIMLILGSGAWSMDRYFAKNNTRERKTNFFSRLQKKVEPYSFLVLRVCFGVAVFFASFYAKFLHSNLALDTVNDYHLINYFHFTPLFLVLGAFIVEAILGVCFATGFEVRLAALVFTGFLTVSIAFFGEVVWPHVILFGVNIALFCHGYDKYTLEMALFERKRRGRTTGEPIL